MAKGEDAVKRMAELDANKGMTGKKKTDIREVGVPNNTRSTPAAQSEPNTSVLSDADLARDRIRQAETMKANAEQMLKEVERLLTEASDLDPTTKTNASKTKKKPAAKVKKD